MPRFDGKVVIITGSSSGIGRATAVLFAKEGASVVITGRNADRLKESEDEVLATGVSSANLLSIRGDITSRDVQKQLIDETIAKFGRLDVLVNNAGAGLVDATGQMGFKSDTDVLQKNLDLNLISVIQLVQVARPHLVAAKGEIINISSIAALNFSFDTFPYYAIAKAALDQATRALSIDLIKEGVRVNSVNPGCVVTKFMSNMGLPEAAEDKAYSYYANRPDCIPSGQVGEPREIAEAIAFLADRQRSSYIIGQTIVADGGSSLIMAMSAHDLGKVIGGQ